MTVEAAILTYTAFVICAFVYSRAIAVAAFWVGVASALAAMITLLYALAGADWWSDEVVQTESIGWTGCPEINGRNEDGEPVILDRCR
jgi:hypothetical protein